jgi:prepilin-type N-terminal cleavage/methylation domain-containing protein
VTQLSFFPDLHDKQHGFTLAEIMVATVITSIIMALAISTVRVSTETSVKVEQVAQREIAAARTFVQLSAGFDAIETHRLGIGWRVHKSGVMRLADGTLHPIMKLRTTSLPRTESDLFSTLELATDRTMLVRRYELQGTRLLVEACYKEQQQGKSEGFKSYILVGIEGGLQITGSAQGLPGSCIRLSATTVQSIFCKSTSLLKSAQLLIPVRSERSLFVDRSSQLRILSHVGSLVLENQPLIRGVSDFRITPMEVGRRNLTFLSSINNRSRHPLQWHRIISLKQGDSWNDILS